MASADNPLADFYNMNALQAMTGPNKYSNYNSGPLQMPGYFGTPTDATGKPIQSFLDAQTQHDAWQPTPGAATPGTTLNTPTPQHGAGALRPGQWDDPTTGLATGTPYLYRTASDPPGQPYATTALQDQVAQSYQRQMGMGQPQQPAAAPQQNPVDMRQAYLSALSNPGPVTTPGATGPQAPTPGQGPDVLSSFLANNKGPSAPGAGGYTNQPFFNTLRSLQGAT